MPSEAPWIWIAVAVVLLVIAIVLLFVSRRRQAAAAELSDPDRTGSAASGASSDGASPDAVAPDPTVTSAAAHEAAAAPGAVDAADPAAPAGATRTDRADDEPVDPPTDPVDLGTHAPSAGRATVMPAAAAEPVPAMAASGADDPGNDAVGAAKNRLLAALLRDPDGAVHAVAGLDHDRPTATSVASLLRSGLTPGQVATLCGTRESALAELVARELGLLGTGSATTRDGDRSADRAEQGATGTPVGASAGAGSL